MTSPTPEVIESFLRSQYDAWNQNRQAEMLAMFDAIAPNGFTIEYVGSAPQEGHEALATICRDYGGNGKTELVSVLINGSEAATVVRNHFFAADSYSQTLSIETYAFSEGTMHVRYFHGPAH